MVVIVYTADAGIEVTYTEEEYFDLLETAEGAFILSDCVRIFSSHG